MNKRKLGLKSENTYQPTSQKYKSLLRAGCVLPEPLVNAGYLLAALRIVDDDGFLAGMR
jgi:hypothetical protein